MSELQVQIKKLVRHEHLNGNWWQLILDAVVVITLLVVHTLYKIQQFPDTYLVLAIVTVLAMSFVYNVNGVYRYQPALIDRFLNLLRGWLTVLALLVAIGFATKTSDNFSREVLIIWSISGLIGQFGVYLIISLLQTNFELLAAPTLLIGARPLGAHLVKHINTNKWISEKFIGVVEDDSELAGQWNEEIPVLGTLDDIDSLLVTHDIRRVYIVLPLKLANQVEPLYTRLADKNVDVIWAPDIFGVSLLNHSITEVAGVPLISLAETPMIGDSVLIKAVLDYSVAAAALVILAPLMLSIAALIKLTSPGPVLFRQLRHGIDGKLFPVLKFRSMQLHEEASNKLTQATKQDDRITPIGRFIRKTSIDELPQLLNVLAGDMSIVGPRPHAAVHNEYYSNKIQAYMTRHRVKPGLTGLAQVNGFRGETVKLEQMESRVQYDLIYINNWSIWLDLKIMLRTVFVLVGKDVY